MTRNKSLGSFFNKLKSFFQKVPEAEVVPFEKIQEWLEHRREEAVLKANLHKESILYAQVLKEKKVFIESQLDGWERRLPLQHQDVKAFFVRARNLLHQVTFPLDPEDRQQVILATSNFNRLIEKELERLISDLESSSFGRNFRFLLSPAERSVTLNPLLKELFELKASRDMFEQKLLKSGWRMFDALHRKRQELFTIGERFQEAEKKYAGFRERWQTAERKKEEKEQEGSRLKEQDDYKNMTMVLATRDDLQRQVYNLVKEVEKSFLILQPVLVQYQQIEDGNKELITSYLLDPQKGLAGDEGLTILHVLQHLKALLDSGKVLSSEEDKALFHTTIETLLQGTLENVHKELFSLRQEMQKHDALAKKNTLIKKVEEEDYKLAHFTEQQQSLQNSLAQLQEHLQERKEHFQREKQFFENLVKVGLGKSLILKVEFSP